VLTCFQLFSVTPGLKRMLIEPQDEGDEHFVDVTDATNLTFKKGESSKIARSKEYDGRKRDPQYANADSSCLWELVSRKLDPHD